VPKILIVDDDRSIVSLLQDILEKSYSTVNASDGQAALYQIPVTKPDLILLDLRLPDIDGVLLIPMIRKDSKTPIIVLSARHRQVDRVTALKAGADDFIDKPFDIDDLEARIVAVLRRSVPRKPLRPPVWKVGSFQISDTWGATLNGDVVPMTPTEYKLVVALTRNAGVVTSRDELTEAIYGTTKNIPASHTIDVHIARLRARFRLLKDGPEIETVRGQGFLIHSGTP
jgi:DNA-binding response OmpR family regulator